jgi:hypothetical protein
VKILRRKILTILTILLIATSGLNFVSAQNELDDVLISENEYETHEMTPGKFYYATIYLSYKAGDTNGITLFGAPGYNTQVNNLKPGITITNVNCIHASLYEGLDGYSPNLNFDQMGFSWQYNSYPPDPSTQYSSQDIVEAHAAGRPYFAIRNVKIVTGN